MILAVAIFVLYSLCEKPDRMSAHRTIERDGYVVVENTSPVKILEYLPDGYVLLDYKYSIKGCALSTFHRDVTSSQYVYKTKHPTYTYIVYANTGDLLSIAPNSNKTVPFLWTRAVIVSGKSGTGVLFDCDMIHAGAMHQFGMERYAEQYKLCHVEDLSRLTHLSGVNKSTSTKCDVNPNVFEYAYVCVLRKMSLMCPYITNHMFTNLLQTRQENIIGKMIDAFFIGDFYNN